MICINQKLDIYLSGHAVQNNAFNDIKEQKRQKNIGNICLFENKCVPLHPQLRNNIAEWSSW